MRGRITGKCLFTATTLVLLVQVLIQLSTTVSRACDLCCVRPMSDVDDEAEVRRRTRSSERRVDRMPLRNKSESDVLFSLLFAESSRGMSLFQNKAASTRIAVRTQDVILNLQRPCFESGSQNRITSTSEAAAPLTAESQHFHHDLVKDSVSGSPPLTFQFRMRPAPLFENRSNSNDTVSN